MITPRRRPPSKSEAKADESMHRITQHTARIHAKLLNGGKAKMRRALCPKQTKLAIKILDLDEEEDDE